MSLDIATVDNIAPPTSIVAVIDRFDLRTEITKGVASLSKEQIQMAKDLALKQLKKDGIDKYNPSLTLLVERYDPSPLIDSNPDIQTNLSVLVGIWDKRITEAGDKVSRFYFIKGDKLLYTLNILPNGLEFEKVDLRKEPLEGIYYFSRDELQEIKDLTFEQLKKDGIAQYNPPLLMVFKKNATKIVFVHVDKNNEYKTDNGESISRTYYIRNGKLIGVAKGYLEEEGLQQLL